MYYVSTRNKMQKITPSGAIAYGLAPDGGLYTPEAVPTIAGCALDTLKNMTYVQRAVYIMGMYLEDYTAAELTRYCVKAYSKEKFDDPAIAPVRRVRDGVYALELWHGPTCAFKDLALQMLPHLLTAALKKEGENKEVCILVATSGDTGKGALEGFRDVPGTRIMVFYPKDGVSAVQELQMVTQEGDNVSVVGVEGNFDDVQGRVKEIFGDLSLKKRLAGQNVFLSSANSINWGRVLPQIIYYFSAYCDLLKTGQIEKGDPVNVCVPTGNFGDILAAWFAKRMGLPLGKLICASNRNNVLTDFIATGVYDRNRPFYKTTSPSMDILVSSNLERLLHYYSFGNAAEVKGYMRSLASSGRYEVSPAILRELRRDFSAGFCGDSEAGSAIRRTWKNDHYLLDPHTAVAMDVLENYQKSTGDMTPALLVSTASPFKFGPAVLDALGAERPADGLECISRLAELTGLEVPAPLAGLGEKHIRFTDTVKKGEMAEAVLSFVK